MLVVGSVGFEKLIGIAGIMYLSFTQSAYISSTSIPALFEISFISTCATYRPFVYSQFAFSSIVPSSFTLSFSPVMVNFKSSVSYELLINWLNKTSEYLPSFTRILSPPWATSKASRIFGKGQRLLPSGESQF